MYAQLVGGRSGKFGVAVLKASMLDCEGRSASISAKFCVAVLKASVLNWCGGRSACTSAKFGVAVFKGCMLDWWRVDLAS